MRSRLAQAATLLVAAGCVLSGCGAEPPAAESKASDAAKSASQSPDPSPDSSSEQPRGAVPASDTWVLRVTGYAGADGERKSSAYLSVVPESGTVHVRRLPARTKVEAIAQQRPLLVSGNHQWVLADTRPAKADRDSGTIRLLSLTGGEDRTLRMPDGVRADWVAFDPTRPERLRVVSGADVWEFPVAGQPERTDTLQVSDSWMFLGGFDKNTGVPFIESISSFKTRPPGNGELSKKQLRRGNGTVLTSETNRLPGLPAPGCDLVTGFREDSGPNAERAWAFCRKGEQLLVKTMPPPHGDTAVGWVEYGDPLDVTLGRGANLDFVLPPASQ